MILNQSKTINKDNSGIKKIKCVSSLGKPRVPLFQQFKGVILISDNPNFIKGQLTNSLLSGAKKCYVSPTGKGKRFLFNSSVSLKELTKHSPIPLANRLTGLQNANLKILLGKKPNLTLTLAK